MQKRMTHAIIQKTAIVTIVKVVIVSKIKKKKIMNHFALLSDIALEDAHR